jgi:hypothetical protein
MNVGQGVADGEVAAPEQHLGPHERSDRRLSRSVPRGPGGEIPPGDPTLGSSAGAFGGHAVVNH